MKSTSKEGKNVERQWRHIPGFSRYMASDTGVVIGMSRQSVMTPYKNKKGYLILTPRNDDGKQVCMPVHRLIWLAFNGPIPDGLLIDHIDDNPGNNHLSNLQLLTNRENVVKGKSQKPKKSKYTGIRILKRQMGLRYMAYIKHRNKQIYLGCYNTELEASMAYERALQKVLNGEPLPKPRTWKRRQQVQLAV